jgi:hypothetical protein
VCGRGLVDNLVHLHTNFLPTCVHRGAKNEGSRMFIQKFVRCSSLSRTLDENWTYAAQVER